MTRPRDLIDIADAIPLTRQVELSPRQTLVVAFSVGCVGFTVYVLAHVVASIFAVLS